MWVYFDDITYKEDLKSKEGKPFAGWEATGVKKGYDGEPDSPWKKIFFDNSTTTIIEKGILRPGMSIVQFLQKGVKKGDTVEIRSEKDGRFWRIVSMENISNKVPTYEPLTDDQIVQMQMQAQVVPVAQKAVAAQSSTVPPWE